ncbi:MAG TPA: hypothetical protein IAA26_06715 [Candidatus Blautia faecipullorum]|nr:hypothetical protein [Candidatus Blautia faecipullorum]
MKKKLTKLLIGAFALAMAVMQPAAALPDTSPLNTIVTADAATATPGKVKLKSIKAVTNNKIQISWNKTSGATHYRIFYKQYGAKRWTVLKTTNADTTSYTHISSAKYPIKCGQRYTYTVRAYNSTTKKWGSYDTKGLTTRTAPTTVALKNAKRNSNNTVTVSWNKAYGGNYYRIYRKTPGSGWKLIATVRSNVLSYTDRNPVKGQKNTYTVRMYNSAMKVAGGYRVAGISVTIPKTNTAAVGTPELTSIKSAAYNKITVNWKKAANATNYRIYYKIPGSSWKLIATVGSNVTSYTHTSSTRYPIRCGQKYTYTVRAYNSNTKKLGGYDASGLTTYTIPSTVELKDAKLNSDGSVTISWYEAYGGDCYYVYRKNETNPNWTPLACYSTIITSFTDENPVVGEKNWYTVRKGDFKTGIYGKLNEPGISIAVPLASPDTSMAEEIIRLTNDERVKRGLAPLQYSQKLSDIAMKKALSFKDTNIFGIDFNYDIIYHGTSSEAIVNEAMGQSSYRDSILNTDYTYTGAAVSIIKDGSVYWIQLFAKDLPDQVFTITLNPNGGACTEKYIIVPSNYHIYQSEIFTHHFRLDYYLKGWAYNGSIFSSLRVDRNMTFDAVWVPR